MSDSYDTTSYDTTSYDTSRRDCHLTAPSNLFTASAVDSKSGRSLLRD